MGNEIIRAEDFSALAATDALAHFSSGTGTAIAVDIASLSIAALPTSFGAVRQAGLALSQTGGSSTFTNLAGSAGIGSEGSFNDWATYGHLDIRFNGTVTGLPDGSYRVTGTFTSSGDIYDGNLSWLDGDATNDRGWSGELATVPLWTRQQAGAVPYDITVQHGLTYSEVVDSNGIVDRANSTVSANVAGQTLTLSLDEINPQESFAEAYLRKQAASGDSVAQAEYDAFVEGQTTSIGDAAVEIVQHPLTTYCFPAGTLIAMPSGQSKIIEAVKQGEIVLAVDGQDLCGRIAAPVVRTFRNVTQQWLKFIPCQETDARTGASATHIIPVCRDDAVDETATYVTPGHAFLNEHGTFEPIEAIVRRGGMIVREDGSLWRVHAERLIYSAATAHLFEEAEVVRTRTEGGLACEPYVERGWATYNFEVEKYHTYIANGWRVHNDSQFYIDTAGAIGQAFGTQLGMMLTEGESQFTQLAAGTALGVVARNLAEVIMDTGFHEFSGPQLDFGQSLEQAVRQLTDIDVDFATAAAGTVSSYLLAELGEELGLEGFGAQLFNVTAGAYAGSVLNTAIANISNGLPALDGADFADALSVLPGAVGTFFGSSLAHEILPAETLEGTIGGSLGSIAGSALGSSFVGSVFGNAASLIGNFLLPGIGAFFGTLIGTFLGDLFGDEPDPHAAIDLFLRTGLSIDRGGLLEVAAQWESVDGFPHDATTAWAEAVHTVGLNYLRTVGGFDVANANIEGLEISQELIDRGFHEGELVRVLQQMHINVDGDDDMHFFVNGVEVDSAENMVDGAIAGFIKDSQVIGGDLLLKRAAAQSTATETPTLSGDMAVAEQYTRYLNDRDVINALIAAQPDSVFSAAWAVTLAQANDLDLADTNITDFHGGLGGFLASLAYAGVSVNPSDVSLSRDSATGKVMIDLHVAAGFQMPGVVDVFADNAELIDQNGERILRLEFSNSMAGVGYQNVTGQQDAGNGIMEVTGETTGRDIWLAQDNASHIVIDSGVRVIGVGAAEIISMRTPAS